MTSPDATDTEMLVQADPTDAMGQGRDGLRSFASIEAQTSNLAVEEAITSTIMSLSDSPIAKPDPMDIGTSTEVLVKVEEPLKSVKQEPDGEESKVEVEDTKTETPKGDVKELPIKSEMSSAAQSPANSQPAFREKRVRKSRSSAASPAPSNSIKGSRQSSMGAPSVKQDDGPQLAEGVEATEEATKLFEVIGSCIYFRKDMADADQDGEIMTCECREEWDGKRNNACGEDSDCINRATRMECVEDDCGCGSACQNMRFQRREFADVSVVKAHKKGYGLRANTALAANDFIYEYVGEVIDEQRFTKRMEAYDKQGIKHFYFMSLKSGEFIDATKKGGLGRFCNHSCNPNCYVDKWVVGDKLRMGIFAKRGIRQGEELVFDYNVDRYGADPQECYCGEPNCVGYIGGKTQTNAGPRLSHHVIEALGLEDDAVFAGKKAKKARKTGEPDEDYTESIPSIHLGEKDVTKVMSTLLHCKERWIIYKLLSRIHLTTDDAVYPRVVRLHGYQILGRILHEYKLDDEMVLLALGIMGKFPRMTKNKITSSRIEPTVQELSKSENEKVRQDSAALLSVWSELETAFRIPRRVGAGPVENVYNDRQRTSRSKSKSPERAIPTGPKALTQSKFNRGAAPPKRMRELPWGWYKAWNGTRFYYYNNDGNVTWWKPTVPCENRTKPKGIPPPPQYEYVPLEREPLPENIQAHEEAQKKKADAEKLRKLVQELVLKKEQERLQEKRRQEEEALRKEEEEKAQKREQYKQRKLYESHKRKEHVETQVKKWLKDICSRYVVRYREDLGGMSETKKWINTILDILYEKTLRSQKYDHKTDLKRVRLKLYSRTNLDRIKEFIEGYVASLLRKMGKKHSASKGSSKSSAASGQAAANTASPLPPNSPVGLGLDLAASPVEGFSSVENVSTPTAGSSKRDRDVNDRDALSEALIKRQKTPASVTLGHDVSGELTITVKQLSDLNTSTTQPPTPPDTEKSDKTMTVEAANGVNAH